MLEGCCPGLLAELPCVLDDDEEMEDAGDEEVWDGGAGAEGARAPLGEWRPVLGGVLLGPVVEVLRSCGEARPVVLDPSANLQDAPDRFVTVLLLRAGLTGPPVLRGCKCEANRWWFVP